MILLLSVGRILFLHRKLKNDKKFSQKTVLHCFVIEPLDTIESLADIAFGQSLADRQYLTKVQPDVKRDLLFSNDGHRANCVYPEDELPVRVPGWVVICQSGTMENLDKLLKNNASAIITVDAEKHGCTGVLVNMGADQQALLAVWPEFMPGGINSKQIPGYF
uniref:Uncharacterized protein n=1 Tax=Leersia perrieri TaxID=77586 RepID=A0A0D9X3L0_9ORYZ